jgi:hypothetical protein
MQLGFPKKGIGKVFKVFLKKENGKRGASSHLGQHAALQRLLGPFFPTSIRSCERLAINGHHVGKKAWHPETTFARTSKQLRRLHQMFCACCKSVA